MFENILQDPFVMKINSVLDEIDSPSSSSHSTTNDKGEAEYVIVEKGLAHGAFGNVSSIKLRHSGEICAYKKIWFPSK